MIFEMVPMDRERLNIGEVAKCWTVALQIFGWLGKQLPVGKLSARNSTLVEQKQEETIEQFENVG